MKKGFSLFCVALTGVLMLSGCNLLNKPNEPAHTEHTYVYDDLNEKSHKKTCSGCDDVEVTENHKYDNDDDLTCNLCGHTRDWLSVYDGETRDSLSANGYVKDKIGDFSEYVGTDAYRTVSTVDELVAALADAKYHYKTTFDEQTKTFTQSPADDYTEENFKGTVHVIEITNDLNLGYYTLSDYAKGQTSIVEDFCRKNANQINAFSMSEMFTENGISQLKVENTSNLLVYSKNGARLTHGGFKLTSDTNVVFRNLEFDEMWQWEDTASASTGAVGDYDAFGWAYFKISFCEYVWIDHCTFGKSYDGQIDYSNPVYNANAGTAFRAPYGATGSNGLHISWCKFNAGSDSQDGYLYKMMQSIEEDYQAGGNNYLYYNALREHYSFEEILYGVAIPQKKGFLCGDSGNGKEDYDYNLSLQISFANCYFKNLEDRLPKIRGGNAVMYNCVVDSLEYISYRNKITSAKSYVTAVNSSWKCALVSQGIVCGNGGSFYGKNCIFRGIESILKNNDKGGTNEQGIDRTVNGGYKIVNCTNQVNATAKPSRVFSSSSSNLKPDYFKWHTEDGEAPFEIAEIELTDLEDMLNNEKYGAGVKTKFQDKLLKSKY